MHLRHIRSLQIDDVILSADALGCGMVCGGNILVTGRTLLQTGQHVEDATLAVVQQQDAQVAPQVLVPQGILIVEETEVTNDAEHPFIGDTREACRRGERALNAVDTTVAVDRMAGVDIGQSDGCRVGVVDGSLLPCPLQKEREL